MTIGGVTPFALPPGMPLWIDGRVMERRADRRRRRQPLRPRWSAHPTMLLAVTAPR